MRSPSQVWIGLLGIAIAAWLFLRVVFRRLMTAWHHRLDESAQQWDRDLWASWQQGEKMTKLRVLTQVKEVYEEIARPLEPFVVVFVLFGIPACVMATDFCKENSAAHSTAT